MLSILLALVQLIPVPVAGKPGMPCPPMPPAGPGPKMVFRIEVSEPITGTKAEAIAQAYATAFAISVSRVNTIKKSIGSTHNYDLTEIQENSCLEQHGRMHLVVTITWENDKC